MSDPFPFIRHRVPSRRIVSLGGFVVTALLAFTVSACASSSGTTTSTRRTSTVRVPGTLPTEITTQAGVGEHTFAASPEAVWATMTAVFEQLEIPVTTMAPATREIGNPGFKPRRIEGRRMNNYIDCGTSLNGQLANLYEITMMVMVQVTADEAGTKVTTVMDAFGEPRGVSGNQVHCETRGTLEDRIPEIVGDLLASGAVSGWTAD